MIALTASFMFTTAAMAQMPDLNKVKDNKVVKQTEAKVELSAKTRAEKLQKDLKLTNEQTTKVTNLFTKQDASMVKLKSDTKVGSEGYKTKLVEIQKSGDTELESIIGKDKYQQYQANMAAEKKQMTDKANSKIKDVKPNLNLK